MCFAPQRRAIFHLSSGQLAPHPPEASLLLDPPEPQIIGKTQCFTTFLPFRAPGSSFFWYFLFFDLLSSSLLFSDSSHFCFFICHHLSILSEDWLVNFLRLLYIYISLSLSTCLWIIVKIPLNPFYFYDYIMRYIERWFQIKHIRFPLNGPRINPYTSQ